MFIVNVTIPIIHNISQFIPYAKIPFKWSAAIANDNRMAEKIK